ncbi:MAG: DoxX family protein [Verrucomicrobiota bacterium]
MTGFWKNWHSGALALLGGIFGFLIFWPGTQKLFGFPPSSKSVEGPISVLILVAGVLGFVGSVLLILRLWTRWSAFILSGMMAIAYWMVFGGKSLLPIVNGGEITVLYCFVFFYLFFAGSGSRSIDNYLQSTIGRTFV